MALRRAKLFIGLEPVFDIFFCYVYLQVSGLIIDHKTQRDISVWAEASSTQRLLGKLIQDESRPSLRLLRERAENKGAQWACL